MTPQHLPMIIFHRLPLGSRTNPATDFYSTGQCFKVQSESTIQDWNNPHYRIELNLPKDQPMPEPQTETADPNWPLQSFDALDWAKEFIKRFPSVPLDMAQVWFANAIMRGYDEHARRNPEPQAPEPIERVMDGDEVIQEGDMFTGNHPETRYKAAATIGMKVSDALAEFPRTKEYRTTRPKPGRAAQLIPCSRCRMFPQSDGSDVCEYCRQELDATEPAAPAVEASVDEELSNYERAQLAQLREVVVPNLTKVCDSRYKEIEAMDSQIIELKRANEQLRIERDNLQNQALSVNLAEHEREELRKGNAELLRQLADSEKQRQWLTSERWRLATKCDELTAERDKLRELVNKWETVCDTSNPEVFANCLKCLREDRAERDQLKAELAKETAEVSQACVERDAWRDKCGWLLKELAALKQKPDDEPKWRTPTDEDGKRRVVCEVKQNGGQWHRGCTLFAVVDDKFPFKARLTDGSVTSVSGWEDCRIRDNAKGGGR